MSTSILSVLLFQPLPDFTALWCRWSCLFSFPLFAFTQSHFSLPEMTSHLLLSNACGWMTETDWDGERERDWWICTIISWGFLFVARWASGPTSLYHFIPLSLHPSLCLLSPLWTHNERIVLATANQHLSPTIPTIEAIMRGREAESLAWP